jgi:hypothetical protein
MPLGTCAAIEATEPDADAPGDGGDADPPPLFPFPLLPHAAAIRAATEITAVASSGL